MFEKKFYQKILKKYLKQAIYAKNKNMNGYN